jgi:hypothetical protein
MILKMVAGELPHPAFAKYCEPLQLTEPNRPVQLQLDRAVARPETGGHVSIALWEHDVGDGHAFEVMYCAKAVDGLEYWNVMYADDTEGPEADLVARSEQGLYFWLFFFTIRSEFFLHGEEAYKTLAAAAKSVGFNHLVEVFRLEEEIGADYDRRRELTDRALSIG